MKILHTIISAACLFCLSSMASAYPVTDVVIINRVLDAGDVVSWTHDMTKYGYLPGDWIFSDFTLTLELRDAEDAPWKEDYSSRPFYKISQSEGRTWGRVYMEDIVYDSGPIFLNTEGKAVPRLEIITGKVWFGRSILSMDIIPVPAPAPMGLLVLGLGALALLRFRGRGAVPTW